MQNKKRKSYTSDLLDDEWGRIKHLIKQDKHYGPKAHTKFSRREMLNAMFYILRTGCQWRDMPNSSSREKRELRKYRVFFRA